MKKTNIFSAILLSTTLSLSSFANLFYGDEWTRREMNEEQITKPLVTLGGCCSGILISENLIMTNYHCNPQNQSGKYEEKQGSKFTNVYTKTIDLNKNEDDTLKELLQKNSLTEKDHYTVSITLDPSRNYKKISVYTYELFKTTSNVLEESGIWGDDYQIVEIKWEKNVPPKNLKYVESIETSEDTLKFGNDKEASKLYVLGVASDKNFTPTYSSGHSKRYNTMSSKEKDISITFLDFNASIDKCSEGAGIFMKNNEKLLGLVRSGPATKWNIYQNSPISDLEDPKEWNWGVSIPHIYPNSNALQAIYPDGQSVGSENIKKLLMLLKN